MTSIRNLSTPDDFTHEIKAMVQDHGLLRVLVAALGVRLKPPPNGRRRHAPKVLSNHLLRDIGLSPVATSPPHWTRYH